MTRPVATELTVVLPTLGRDLAVGCLESLASGDTWPAAVLVVDQGRTELLARACARLRARGLAAVHLPSSQRGIAAGTNRGLERVETPLVAVTHDDCRVAPDWVRRMRAALQRAGDALVTGRVVPEGEGANPTVNVSLEPEVHRAPVPHRDVLFPPNMGFGLRVLQRIGPLDEHPSLALAGEDNEWAYRALRQGVPIVFDPTVAVSHVAWRPASALGDVYRRYAYGQGAFYGKYLRRGDPFIARRAAYGLLRAPWLLLRGAASRNPALLAMARGELLGLLPGIVAGVRNRG